MSVVFVRGVPWLDRALEAAERAGLADAVTDLVIEYRGDGPMTAVPGADRIRLVRDGVTALVTHTGVVFGFQKADPDDPAPEPAPRGTSPKKRRKAAVRGPHDYPELIAWLREAGLEVETTASNHRRVLQDGKHVATMSGSPSDARSFANDVQSCRRATGLPLRKRS